MVGSRFALSTLGTILVVLGCNSSTDPNAVTLVQLEGAWLVSRYEYTSLADPERTRDLLADGSLVTVDIAIDGRFVLATAFPPGAPPATDPGSLRVGNRDIVMEFDMDPDEPLVFEYSFRVDSLTLRTDDATFEFTGGASEPSSLVIELTRIVAQIVN